MFEITSIFSTKISLFLSKSSIKKKVIKIDQKFWLDTGCLDQALLMSTPTPFAEEDDTLCGCGNHGVKKWDLGLKNWELKKKKGAKVGYRKFLKSGIWEMRFQCLAFSIHT